MKSDSGSIDIDGFKLRYQFEGRGLPTIVIGSTVEHPRTFSSNLRAHLELIACPTARIASQFIPFLSCLEGTE